MQVMIVTKKTQIESWMRFKRKMRRGITIIHEAEGAYHHDRQTVFANYCDTL